MLCEGLVAHPQHTLDRTANAAAAGFVHACRLLLKISGLQEDKKEALHRFTVRKQKQHIPLRKVTESANTNTTSVSSNSMSLAHCRTLLSPQME